jgi:type II secretory pathway component PulC
MDNISPEEKLLRLIKGSAVRREKPKEAEIAKQKNLELTTPVSGQPRLGAFYAQARPKFLSRIFTLEAMNKLATVLLILIAILFLFDLVLADKIGSGLYPQDAAKEKEADSFAFPKTLDKDFGQYMAQAGRRDIFSGSQKTAGGFQSTGFSSSRADYANSLKLLGVISGDKPQAVIEDQGEQKSYTVSVGDYIKDFLVDEVGLGRVRLDYKGAKFDLFL